MKKSLLVSILLVVGLLFVVLSVTAQEIPQLAAPPSTPSELPNRLPEVMAYEQPLPDCANQPDASRSCSLLQGQLHSGKFTLGANTVRFATGDHIAFFAYGDAEATSSILTPEGVERVAVGDFAPGLEPGMYQLLAQGVDGGGRYSVATDPTGFTYESAMVWVLANTSGLPVEVGMWVPYGGFWGDGGQPIYEPISVETLQSVRDLHINKMVFANLSTTEAIESSSGAPVYPATNPANCADVFSLEVNTQTYCVGVNVIVVVWDGSAWNTISYGLAYNFEGQLKWVDLAPMLVNPS